jgi:hypothetical protein
MKSNSTILAVTFAVFAAFLGARAKGADANVEFAIMPSTMDVTLLNEGGKFVTVDLKKIAKGEKCRMDKNAFIMKVGPGQSPNTVRVRFAAPQFSSGGCPFMTEFELAEADYTAARTAFTSMSDEAKKKFENLKKQLGDKWNELTGSK